MSLKSACCFLLLTCCFAESAPAQSLSAYRQSYYVCSDSTLTEFGKGSPTPVVLSTVTGVVAVDPNDQYAMLLKGDSTVWTWGDGGNFGQLGHGDYTSYTVPTLVDSLDQVVRIAAGYSTSLALKGDGTVWACGAGLLGNGTSGSSLTFIPVPSLVNVAAIDIGNTVAIALKADGTVWTWGGSGPVGSPGCLGNGTNLSSTVPVQVTALSGITAVSTLGPHVLALKSDGSVWSWGFNYQGQLGNGSTANSNVPAPVSGLNGVVAIAAGGAFSLALKSDGTVWSWGSNSSGELGNGAMSDSPVPVQVSGLTGVASIAAGFQHAFAVGQGGELLAWGRNTNGELGNGNNINVSLPETITGVCALLQPAQATGPQSPHAIEIGPNPFSYATRIRSDVYLQDAILSVYNTLGQRVKRMTGLRGHVVELSRDSLPEGIYYARLTMANEPVAVFRLLVQ